MESKWIGFLPLAASLMFTVAAVALLGSVVRRQLQRPLGFVAMRDALEKVQRYFVADTSVARTRVLHRGASASIPGSALDWPRNTPIRTARFLQDTSVTPDDKSKVKTAAAATQTGKPRFSLSALRKVALLFGGEFVVDRKEYLTNLYGPFFGDVFFVAWNPRPDQPSANLTNVFWCGDPDWRRNPHLHWHWQSLCLPSILDKLKENKLIQGVLALHYDIWLHPGRLTSEFSVDSIWQLGPVTAPPFGVSRPLNAGPKCFPTLDAVQNDTWGWGAITTKKHASDCHAATSLVKQHFSLSSVVEFCRNWSDLFYLPRLGWSVFQRLAPFFENVFHETAIPTMLNILVKHFKIMDGPRLSCWGGCYATWVNNFDDLRNFTCGHKIDLRDVKKRNMLWKMITEEQELLAAP